jgi:transcriptional regulator GlxA family with amidase domain
METQMLRRPLRVHIPVFPECDPSIVFGVYDTLWGVGRMWSMLHGKAAAAGVFEPRLVGATVGTIDLVTGVSIVLQDSIHDIASTDIVFVPNVLVEDVAGIDRLDAQLIAWVDAMYTRGATVYAACGGSIVLARAGLLDGLETTTHWGYAPLMRHAFPEVTVREDRIIVQSGAGHRIVCCGGASSWQDLCLFLIARHAGSDEALRISKIFLYQWHREGQLPFSSFVQNSSHDDLVIKRIQDWLAVNYRRHDAVAGLAEMAGLSKRTFDRRFRRATGHSPLEYVQLLRIEEAKHQFETTDHSVEAVGLEVGYEDTRYFRTLFKRLTGMQPGAYRRKFGWPDFAKPGLPVTGPSTPLRQSHAHSASEPRR